MSDFSPGDRLVAWQSSAPVGWTKSVDIGLDRSALRVVTTSEFSPYSGGDRWQSVFAPEKTTDKHTLTTKQLPAHSHPLFLPDSNGDVEGYSKPGEAGTGTVYENFIGGGEPHLHRITMDLNHQDVILIEKD